VRAFLRQKRGKTPMFTIEPCRPDGNSHSYYLEPCPPEMSPAFQHALLFLWVGGALLHLLFLPHDVFV